MSEMNASVRSKRQLAVGALVAVGIAALCWRIFESRRPVFVTLSGPGEIRVHTQSTGAVTFMLRPGASYPFEFVVPANHEIATLKGRFSVTNDDKTGIEAFVVNDEDYTSWREGYTTYRYYDSGYVQQGMVNVPLRAWSKGTYYVVFQNQLSATTTKRVTADLSLIYSTRWWSGMPD